MLQASNAFSLIEVILAIGVVGFALLGIVSLFSVSMRNNRDTSAQQEGFAVERILPSRLQDTNFLGTSALATMASNLWQTPGSSSNFFVFTSNNAGILTTVVSTTNPPSYTTSTNYSGKLYYAQLSASTNASPTLFPTTKTKGGTTISWSTWPALPVHSTVYSIPSPSATNTITNSVPVISFDFMIFR
jgi:uncharacterized protein (TIGR02598 family)